MKKNLLVSLLGLAALVAVPVNAQDGTVKLKGIGHNNRYDDGEQMKSTWIGSLYDENGNYTGKTAFIVDNGIYAMNVRENFVSMPTKEPAVNIDDIRQGMSVDYEKALWATNFNLMYGNSGAAYIDGQLLTVYSRDESSTTDEELFAVRTWDATTGNMLTNQTYPRSATLESAGISVNPADGKVYGLFYLTGQDLPAEITSDPEYFVDQDADMTDGDAGYAICTLDPETMTVTPITPGLYYYNFITFAINSEGRAFALTSGGTNNNALDDNGRMVDIDGNLSGAQLYEFDLTTGLMKTKAVTMKDENGETYTAYEPLLGATGYCSQYRRQAACFAKSEPDMMYWVGYVNSGKGYNDWGSWSSLSDKEWRTNGKFDTCLYTVDINTGMATRVAKIPNRWIFSALWVDGDDPSDGAYQTAISDVTRAAEAPAAVYDLQGRKLSSDHLPSGLYIVNGKKRLVK